MIREIKKEYPAYASLVDELRDDGDDEEALESEEWMVAIDRGGLVYPSEEFFQTLCAAEYSIRVHFKKIEKCTVELDLKEDMCNDIELQFYWNLASADIGD